VYQGKGQAPIGDTISSGGFSTFYSRYYLPPPLLHVIASSLSSCSASPSYQDAAVSAYLSQGGLPPRKQFNSTGRAIPDVSSYSENVAVYQGGGIEPVGNS